VGRHPSSLHMRKDRNISAVPSRYPGSVDGGAKVKIIIRNGLWVIPAAAVIRTEAGRKVLSCVSASALAYRIHRLIGAAEYLTPEQAAGAAVVMAGGSRLLADEQPA
jgi:hypothetical protein